VLRYPLGPAFPANAFQDFSFTHDGGEIIFNLPNGLQAYLLVDDAGNRLLTPAPIDIVADETSRASGTAAVVNGLSCIACHSDGIKHASDVVRNGSSVGGEALAKVQSLHPIQEKFDELVRMDQDRYLAALKLSVAPFSDGNASNKLDTEPILLLARAYQKPLNLEKAASELNTTAERLAEAIRTHDSLRKMGLGPLAEGERITRSVWESREFAVSPMQQASRILGAGAPISY
jgi:serine/threonine-protein kinase